MNDFVHSAARARINGGKASRATTPSYILVERHSGLDSIATSATVGLFEANLTPPDELWNRPNALLDVVRSAQYDVDPALVSGSGSFNDALPTAFVSAPRPAIANVVKPSKHLQIRASTPVGIWKGVIKSIDLERRTFSAELTPLRGSDEQVAGDISFDQINDDDFPMAQLGAVFYLEQYSRTVKRQVSSDTIVRFRRGNLWTDEQLRKVSELSAGLAAAMSEGRARMKIAD